MMESLMFNDRAPVIDFSDRETIPAELIPETRLPEPEVTELWGERGRMMFLAALHRFMGGAV